jgi:PAS domain S-box-containing protein
MMERGLARMSEKMIDAARTERLGSAEEILELLLENVQDFAIITLDAKARVAGWNVGAERLLGYTAEEVVGHTADLIFTFEDQTAGIPQREIGQAQASGRALDERWHVRKDGSRLFASGAMSALRDRRGRLRGYVKILRDQTEQRQADEVKAALITEAEAARQAAEQAQRLAEVANRAKDEFLATVSHELRTPLNAIVGWAHMLRQDSLDRATTDKAVDTIVRNANNQARLINDLLDMSRIVSGHLRLDIQEVELLPVIESALDTVRLAADAREIALESRLDPEAEPILGDPVRMQQVVWNLLSNAIKFTPHGGRVEVALERSGRHVRILVSDTGQGMSADLLPFIFQRFRRGDGTSTRQQAGLGLGLAIVRHIVELHGGSVQAFSEGPGCGSRFEVVLPWWNPKEIENAGAPGADAAIDLRGMRVLLVEDDRDTRDLVTTMLRHFRGDVRPVGSAAEALAAMDTWTPDVLVSDIHMPETDGYDLIRAVRARSPERGGAVPAVALTALARSEDHRRALDAGYQVHVPKPVTPAKLTAVLGFLLRQPRPEL